ncbi:MAG: bacteriochlorophyll 4-vinyl reductase [Hyphomicrobiaceae bacterium]
MLARPDTVARHPPGSRAETVDARVGPNAIIQVGAALRDAFGPQRHRDIFAAAALDRYVERVPEAMVPERQAAALFAAVRRELTEGEARQVFRVAGLRTADYILAHRIPAVAQGVLKRLPDVVAARLLLSAIRGHAWTFAGSGAVSCSYGRMLSIAIAGNPLATPGCDWHVAVFEGLFRTLVSPGMQVRHVSCCANGASSCRSQITGPAA